MAFDKVLLALRVDSKEAVRGIDKVTKSVGQLEKELEDFRKAAKTADSVKQQKKLKQSIDQTSAALHTAKKRAGLLGQSLNQTGRGFLGLSKRIAQGFGILTVITTTLAILKNAVSTIVDFDQGAANLASVLGVTRSQMEALTDQAKELGGRTAFTAKQVLELQTELARLGFTQKEIIASSKDVIDLTLATGTTSARAAALAGASIRAFGLEAEEMGRVVSTLAVGTTKSALSFEKLEAALPLVSAVAKSANVTIEETTALLGVLSDRGLQASIAGTSLRNIFLEISKQGLTFNEAMDRIEGSSDKASTSLELFGKRGAVAGLILAGAGDQVRDLTKAITDQDEVLKRMVDERMKTVKGELTLAASAWSRFITALDDGEGVMSNVVKKALQGFSEDMNFLADVVNLTNEELDEHVTLLDLMFAKLRGDWKEAARIRAQLDINIIGSEEGGETTRDKIIAEHTAILNAVIKKSNEANAAAATLAITLANMRRAMDVDPRTIGEAQDFLNTLAAYLPTINRHLRPSEIEAVRKRMEELREIISGKSPKKGGRDRTLQNAKARLKAELDIYKIRQQESIRFLEKGIQAEELDGQTREILAKKHAEIMEDIARKEMLNLIEITELEVKHKKLTREAGNAIILKAEAEFTDTMLQIGEDYADTSIKIWQAHNKELEDIREANKARTLAKEDLENAKEILAIQRQLAQDRGSDPLRNEQLEYEAEVKIFEINLRNLGIEIARVKAAAAIARAKGNVEAAARADTEALELQIEYHGMLADLDILKKEREDDLRNARLDLEKFAAQQLIDVWAHAFETIFNLEQHHIQTNLDERLEAIDREYDRLTERAEENAILREHLEVERQALIDEAQKKAAKEEQKLRIKQAIANSAVAITKTFAQMGGTPAAFIAAAAVALKTGIEVAALKQMKFAEGGFTGKGLPYKDETGRKVAGVVHQDEYVASTEQLVKYPQLFKWLDNDRRKTTRTYAQGGFTSIPQLANPSGAASGFSVDMMQQMYAAIADAAKEGAAIGTRIGAMQGIEEGTRIGEREGLLALNTNI